MENSTYINPSINGQDTFMKYLNMCDFEKNGPQGWQNAWEEIISDDSNFGSRNGKLGYAFSLAYEHPINGGKEQPFWNLKALACMMSEIEAQLYDDKNAMKDCDRLHGMIHNEMLSKLDPKRAKDRDRINALKKAIMSFDKKYAPRKNAKGKTYSIPDTFKACWLNNGAYISMIYMIRYLKADMLKAKGYNLKDVESAFEKKVMDIKLEMFKGNDEPLELDDTLFRLAYKSMYPEWDKAMQINGGD